MSFHAPQIIVLMIMSARLTVNTLKHGENIELKYSSPRALVGQSILFGLLYWGGFFR